MTPDAPINLDDVMTPEECAPWAKVTVSWLANDRAQTYPKVPFFKLGAKTVRYHRRTILAVWARRAQIDHETIAASYGTNPKAENV